MMKSPKFTHKFYQQGITIIEAIVAMVVFSVGALGLAAMQTASLVQSDDSKQRALAIWKAQELVDRIRSTKTPLNPNGLIEGASGYLSVINNSTSFSASGIGQDNSDDRGYQCPANPPTRCSEGYSDSGTLQVANTCTAAQLVAFDVWEVLCDTRSGLSTNDVDATGSLGLQEMEIALIPNGSQYQLYIEWVSGSGEKNASLNDGTTVNNIQTNLCGTERAVDSRLDVYCLEFQ